jgi:hypothetical protein
MLMGLTSGAAHRTPLMNHESRCILSRAAISKTRPALLEDDLARLKADLA